MEMSKMFAYSLKGSLKKLEHKILGKVTLIKPVRDKLKIASIIEKEILDKYSDEEMEKSLVHHENISYGKASEILILNRLMAPKPMYEIEEWVDTKTCIGDLYNVPEGCMNDDLMASLLDTVNPCINNVWSKLIQNSILEFPIEFGTLFNDITSTYFEGVYAESNIIKYGYSRDQKPDKKQGNLGVDVNNYGVPLCYKILEGNKADKSTVIENMEDIIHVLKETELKN